MIIYVIHSETICGHLIKRLSFMQAIWWLRVLTENKVKHRIEYEFERGPHQYEFVF